MKNWNRGDIFNDIKDELQRAKEKFPDFHSFHEGYAVLLEEMDELWESIKRDDTSNMYEEAVQVGAMAMRFLIDLAEYEHGK